MEQQTIDTHSMPYTPPMMDQPQAMLVPAPPQALPAQKKGISLLFDWAMDETRIPNLVIIGVALMFARKWFR